MTNKNEPNSKTNDSHNEKKEKKTTFTKKETVFILSLIFSLAVYGIYLEYFREGPKSSPLNDQRSVSVTPDTSDHENRHSNNRNLRSHCEHISNYARVAMRNRNNGVDLVAAAMNIDNETIFPGFPMHEHEESRDLALKILNNAHAHFRNLKSADRYADEVKSYCIKGEGLPPVTR